MYKRGAVELARLVDAASLGWVAREPGAPDVTLELIRLALLEVPSVTRPRLRLIAANDAEIARLTRMLGGD